MQCMAWFTFEECTIFGIIHNIRHTEIAMQYPHLQYTVQGKCNSMELQMTCVRWNTQYYNEIPNKALQCTVPPSIATQFRCRWREAPQDTACRRRRRLFNLFTGNWKRETIFTSNFPTFSPSYFHGKEEKIFSSHFCLESGLYKNMKPIKIIIQETNCGPPSWLLWRKASGCKIGGATVVFSHWGAVFSALWDNGSHKERKNLVRVKASSESKDIHCLPFQFLYKCRDMKHETMK